MNAPPAPRPAEPAPRPAAGPAAGRVRARLRGVRVPPVWLAAATAAAAFFGMEHLFEAATLPDYAPSQEAMEGANTTADPARRVALLALLALGSAGLWKGDAARWRWGGLAGAAAACWYGWLGLSVFWSHDPRVTLRRAVVLAVFLLCAAGVCKLLTGRQVVKLAALAVGLQLGFGVLVELGFGTFRPWRGDYRFAGTIHPNIQALQLSGACVAAAALAAFGRDWAAKLRWAAAAAGLFAFLWLTKSRTSTGGAVLAVAGVLVLSVPPRWKKIAAVPLGLLGSAAALASLFGGFDPTAELRDAALMGRDEQRTSLSGRLPIWEALDPYVARKYWRGWGYQSFWTKTHIDALTTAVDFKFSGAHSAWYEARLDGGVVGAALMAATLCFGLVRAGWLFVTDRGPVPAFAFGVLTCAAVNGLLEALICDVRLFPLLMVCGLLKITFLPDPPAATGTGLGPGPGPGRTPGTPAGSVPSRSEGGGGTADRPRPVRPVQSATSRRPPAAPAGANASSNSPVAAAGSSAPQTAAQTATREAPAAAAAATVERSTPPIAKQGTDTCAAAHRR